MENLEEITAKTDTDPQQWIGSGVCVCVCVVSHEYWVKLGKCFQREDRWTQRDP